MVFVLPDGSESQPSGGNEYDRRLVEGLRDDGWTVDLRPVASVRAVAGALADVTDGATVLVDGLLAVPSAATLAAHAARLRLITLMHMTMALPPPGHAWPGAADAERSVLDVTAAVITTSQWLRDQVTARHHIDPRHVSVAPPGVDQAPEARPSPSGGRLLCVAPVAPHKGHDVLVAALAHVAELPWTCTCVGPLDRDGDFVAALHAEIVRQGFADRISFTGAHTRAELADDYGASDLLLLPTRSETYGMVLTEALARSLPVLASDVGGVAEAVAGGRQDAPIPGALVPPEDPGALADQLRRWLTDAGTRAAWRRRARQRRAQLLGWDSTVRCVVETIERVLAPPGH